MKLSLINKRIKQKWVKPDNLKVGETVRFIMPSGSYKYCKISDVDIDFINGHFHMGLNKIDKGTYGGIYISTVSEVLR